mmetsp:Transcript_2917/g.5505  ORF Transcript_2917/g.5505 Transcript_2917/m.5505 type:complete len:243 (+) Transcript_2917:705-1433(+)
MCGDGVRRLGVAVVHRHVDGSGGVAHEPRSVLHNVGHEGGVGRRCAVLKGEEALSNRVQLRVRLHPNQFLELGEVLLEELVEETGSSHAQQHEAAMAGLGVQVGDDAHDRRDVQRGRAVPSRHIQAYHRLRLDSEAQRSRPIGLHHGDCASLEQHLGWPHALLGDGGEKQEHRLRRARLLHDVWRVCVEEPSAGHKNCTEQNGSMVATPIKHIPFILLLNSAHAVNVILVPIIHVCTEVPGG